MDESKWWQGTHPYTDPDSRYIFIFQGDVRSADIAYNTKLVNPDEIKSYWDLMDPKWQGKIVLTDPRVTSITSTGLRLFYYNKELGPKFLRQLYGKMDVTLARSHPKMMDWLGVGKYSLAFFAGGTATAARQGLPVQEFEPNRFKEGATVAPNRGSANLIKQGPHPNAARVFLNWLLSREGQTAFQTIFAEKAESPSTNSMREDVPKDSIPP